MKKSRPDPDTIANELARGSSFFKKPTRAAQSPAGQPTPLDPAHSSQEDQPQTYTSDRPVRPKRRQMIRHAFEVYMDQLEDLREVAALQREWGEVGSMSKMVREAIDRLLRERRPPNA